MALNHKIESRMKKIMAAGLAGGLIVGVAATGIFTTVTGNTKEKEYQDKITSLEKELKNAQKEEEETGTDLEVIPSFGYFLRAGTCGTGTGASGRCEDFRRRAADAGGCKGGGIESVYLFGIPEL